MIEADFLRVNPALPVISQHHLHGFLQGIPGGDGVEDEAPEDAVIGSPFAQLSAIGQSGDGMPFAYGVLHGFIVVDGLAIQRVGVGHIGKGPRNVLDGGPDIQVTLAVQIAAQHSSGEIWGDPDAGVLFQGVDYPVKMVQQNLKDPGWEALDVGFQIPAAGLVLDDVRAALMGITIEELKPRDPLPGVAGIGMGGLRKGSVQAKNLHGVGTGRAHCIVVALTSPFEMIVLRLMPREVLERQALKHLPAQRVFSADLGF